MIQNDKYLKESIDILNRKFGEPLPTLEDTMKAHKLKKEGGSTRGTCWRGSWTRCAPKHEQTKTTTTQDKQT